MEKQNTISKHAKRRANKKAQKEANGGTQEDQSRDQQIKENEYAAGGVKSNEEMKDEEPIVEKKQAAP